jgi:hypothetical protein
MTLKKFNFELLGSPDDVGMKTGATIHTMNGLKMTLFPCCEIPKTHNWWENQHLKRGLSPSGLPYDNEEDAVWGSESVRSKSQTVADPSGQCPVH